MHYYDYSRILSYNAPVNILIGERGVGKSFGAKDYVISQNIKKDSQFIYLRRYENELKEIFDNKKDYFDDIKYKYPNYNLHASNKKFFINDFVFGTAKRMTGAQDLKSSTHEKVKTIIIDEYFIEKNRRYYLPNEGMILLSIFDSIIRNRDDVKIFILGNAVEGIEYSPLFTFFDLSMPYGNDIKLFKENTILVQYMKNEEFRKERENTLIGKLSKGTAYQDYAFNNKILDKNNDFIEKKKGTAKFSFAFVFEEIIYRCLVRLLRRKNICFFRLQQKFPLFLFFYFKRPHAKYNDDKHN